MNRLLITSGLIAAFFICFLSLVIIPEEISIALIVIVYSGVAGVMLALLLTLMVGYESYRTRRARRKQTEREAATNAPIVAPANHQVHVLDGHGDWVALHLDPRVYSNSRATWQEASDRELLTWREFHRPAAIQTETRRNDLLLTDGEQQTCLYDLLTTHPHLMLIGGSGSGKTTIMAQVVAHLMGRAITTRAVWLSTHLRLDMDKIPSTVIKVQDLASIAQCLNSLLQIYRQRRDTGELDYQIIVALDEWPEIIRECEVSQDILPQLANCGRKVGIHLVLCSQEDNVTALGLAGRGQVERDFAKVYLNRTSTAQHVAIWQPAKSKHSRIEIALPPAVENNTCACGCGLPVDGKATYATNACRQRAYRERNVTP